MATGLVGQPDVVAFTKPRSPAAEAFRTLRTNLQFSSPDRVIRRLLFTSAGSDEGKSTVVANLAVTMAQGEMKVIVVDCDLRRPMQHTIFNLRNTAGITSLFVATAGSATTASERAPQELDVPLQQTAVPDLWLLSSGPLPPNPADLLASARMEDILNHVAARADIILLDAPPIVAVTDAAVLSAKVDGVLLVVGAGTVTRDLALRAKAQLEAVNAPVLGLVVNNVPFDATALGGYYEPSAGT